MTEPLFRHDAYLREAPGRVVAHTDAGVVLDASLFYATGGGQPGDSGWLDWDGRTLDVTTTVKGDGGSIVLQAAGDLPPVGAEVIQRLDWDKRLRHMRVHTALHLLSVVLPWPVTGGAIGAQKGRLDFAMEGTVEDKAALAAEVQALIDRDLPVTEDWITDEALAANPGLVKTMSVMPPTGQGRVRLIRIGQGEAQIDLQPCGGTHVRSTAEIGQVAIGKVEKKGAQNRRVNLLLVD